MMSDEQPISPGPIDPPDSSRPLPDPADLRIPRQVRRSWALEDLD